MAKPLTRRAFLRQGGLCATAATLAASPLAAAAAARGGPPASGLRWGKAPCRFCGVGCGVLVGTRKGRVVAVKGDDQHPGNRGLLCAKGYIGNSDRRTQHWEKLAEPPKGCLPDDWQILEVARRMGLGGLFPADRATYVRELYEEYRQFTLGTGKDLATYDDLRTHRGLRWPVVDGKETARRYVEGEDPFVKSGEGIKFYKNKADGGRAVVWLRPWEPAAEVPDAEYPLWFCTGRMLEHWHTGTLTRRVPQLHRAMPAGFLELHPEDAKAIGAAEGDLVKVTSRRGSVSLPCRFTARGQVPRGTVYTSFFDESQLINAVTLDSYCPISAEPDYKKCACRVEKA
jgi:nitrate reductase NapA